MIDALSQLSPLWLVIVIVWVAVVVGMFVGWLLRGSEHAARGGILDLTPAAARGELDLDWSDPRHDVDVCQARGTFEETLKPPPPASVGPPEPPRPPLHRPVSEATALGAVGATVERPRLGLVSNVVPIASRRA